MARGIAETDTLEVQTRAWLESLFGQSFPSNVTLAALLANGCVLAEVARAVEKAQKGEETDILDANWLDASTSSTTAGRNAIFMAYDKVTKFFKVCRSVGLSDVDLFIPSDVVEQKGSTQLCLCLRRLAKLCHSKGIKVPAFEETKSPAKHLKDGLIEERVIAFDPTNRLRSFPPSSGHAEEEVGQETQGGGSSSENSDLTHCQSDGTPVTEFKSETEQESESGEDITLEAGSPVTRVEQDTELDVGQSVEDADSGAEPHFDASAQPSSLAADGSRGSGENGTEGQEQDTPSVILEDIRDESEEEVSAQLSVMEDGVEGPVEGQEEAGEVGGAVHAERNEARKVRSGKRASLEMMDLQKVSVLVRKMEESRGPKKSMDQVSSLLRRDECGQEGGFEERSLEEMVDNPKRFEGVEETLVADPDVYNEVEATEEETKVSQVENVVASSGGERRSRVRARWVKIFWGALATAVVSTAISVLTQKSARDVLDRIHIGGDSGVCAGIGRACKGGDTWRELAVVKIGSF